MLSFPGGPPFWPPQIGHPVFVRLSSYNKPYPAIRLYVKNALNPSVRGHPGQGLLGLVRENLGRGHFLRDQVLGCENGRAVSGANDDGVTIVQEVTNKPLEMFAIMVPKGRLELPRGNPH